MSNTSPVVNGNGTNREALKAERMTAIGALHAAESALYAVTVNGRDFIGDPDRYTRAVAAHQARIAAVHAAIADLTDEVIALRKS
jgi:hypothetical protein